MMRKNNSIIFYLKGNKKAEYYKKNLIRADFGLHNQIINIVDRLFTEKDIKILDIASGTGSLSSQLFDIGYNNIECVDLTPNNSNLSQKISFYSLDLNDFQSFNNYSSKRVGFFDLILGIETIEHLENPWNYIRNLSSMLKPNGYIILTTPNISSLFSKVNFLLNDKFFQFDNSDQIYGHINPISDFEIRTICNSCNLKIKEHQAGGLYPIIWNNNGIRFTMIYSLSNIILYPFCRGLRYGWCSLYLIEKK
jgi:2-polyprenyl-3-methyl-5-hydroxy-6-metoxy-1,4-benzoquinol methylase